MTSIMPEKPDKQWSWWELKAIENEFYAIRTKAYEQQPYWSIVLHNLQVEVCKESEGRAVRTAATDGKYIYINPSFWSDLSLSEKISLVLHEAAHVALAHHLRRQERNPPLWNIAGDEVINEILKANGNPIPEEWVHGHPDRVGWAEERIYHELDKQKREDPPPPGKKPPKGGGGQPPPPGGKKSGEEEPGEEEKPQPPGEVWDAVDEEGKPLSGDDREREMRKLANDITQARTAAKHFGKSETASQRRATNRLVKPKMNWKAMINRWVKQVGRPIGRAWNKIDRRSLALGIYMPHEIKGGIDWLVCFIDVSGSVDMVAYKAYISNFESIRKTVDIAKISIIPFNHIILQEQIAHMSRGEKLPKDIMCGGGTRYAPIFNWIRRQDKSPDAIMIFTDLWCSDYGEPVDVPILWAASEPVYKSESGRTHKPPFGDVVEINV